MPATAPMTIRVRGASMRPTLADGDEVQVDVFARAPRIGEVVLLRLDGDHVLHRVIEIGPTHLRTQGDARPGPDAEVPLTAVLGIARLPARPLRARVRALIARTRAALRSLARCLPRPSSRGKADARGELFPKPHGLEP